MEEGRKIMIYVPQELRKKVTTKKGLGGFDVIAIFLALVFSLVVRGFTYGFLQYLFPVFFTGVVIWLVLPSSDDYRAKNFQVLIQALKHKKIVYVPVPNERKRIRKEVPTNGIDL